MAAQQQQGQNDSSMGFLWVLVGLFAAGLLVWYVWHDIIIEIFFKIKLAEIAVISLFTSSLDSTRQLIEQTPPGAIGMNEVTEITSTIGRKICIPIAILFCFLSFVLYKGSAKNRYRRTHSMKSLAEQERENWPFITPVMGLDLINTPIDEGPWAMAEPPMRFAKRNKLLIEERKRIGESGLSRDTRIVVTVKRGKANRLFAKQLGQPWKDIHKFPIYIRALFAIFAAKAEGDRIPAMALLRQIAASATSHPIKYEKLNFKGVDALLKKHENSKIVKKVLSQHAYLYTVMASMMEIARLDGVLATAEFIWLKPVDRPLWYVLNTVGRQTAPVEVAGIMAHWLAEKGIGRSLAIPMVEQASIALELALAELIYIPDEE